MSQSSLNRRRARRLADRLAREHSLRDAARAELERAVLVLESERRSRELATVLELRARAAALPPRKRDRFLRRHPLATLEA